MAVFEYTAINAKGRKVRGVIDAEGAKAARQRLKSKGIFATDLKETRTKAKSGASNKRGYHFVQARVSLGELSLATRQLSTLVGAGISLVEALKALGDQLDSDKLKRIFSEICEQVTEGSSLAEALKSYPRIFPQLYINMVASGEASGSLDLVLERLADLLESQAELRRKIISASAYPILMLVVCFLVVLLLLGYVVPQITALFKEQNQALPLPTQIVIGLSDLTQQYWWLLLLTLAGSYYGYMSYSRTKNGRKRIDHLKLTLPVTGPLSVKIIVSRLSRTLATMLASGVELLTALSIVKNIVGNVIIEEALESAIVGVREGKSLSAELKKSGIFPTLLVHLVGVGERTGELEPMLFRVSKSYESQVDALVSGLTKIMEPILILFLAVVVGGILASVMLPMLEMSSLSAS